MKQKIIVVGAGLAGLSCAFELASEKREVLMIEARDVIGGRTSSWIEKGMKVESGLHRFLGFYSALPDLLKRAGVDLDKMLFWEDEIEIIMPDNGPRAVMGAAPFFKPVETLKGVLDNSDLLNLKDKLSLGKFFAAGLKDYTLNPDKLDRQNVLSYAKKYRVTKRAIEHLLIPVTSGIFFLPPEKYSMYALMGLVAPYILKLPKLRIGAFMGGMTEVMCQPIASHIRKKGRILLNEKVIKLIIKEGNVVGVQTNKAIHYAQYIVLASSLSYTQEIIKKSFKDTEIFKDLLSLPSMPAVTIQFELKKRSMEMDRTTFGPLTSWTSFAEQSHTTFRHAKGRLSVILTPPGKFLKMKDKEILDHTLKEGKRLGIDITDTVMDFRVTRIPSDFYSLSPGNEKLRPTQKTQLAGLLLAGDYTKQPYLATMEGAVVSGKLAAEQILNGQ